MKQFYTIVKFIPIKATKDSIAIGLLYFDGIRFSFYVSDNKMKIVNKLIDKETINIDLIINQFKKKLNLLVDPINNEFDFGNNPINESYLSYLNKYSNGFISFSEPIYLSNNFVPSDFENLVSYLFPNDNNTKKEVVIQSKFEKLKKLINKKLIKRVEDKVYTNFVFNKEILPTIYFNYEVDCIGLNGAFIGAKAIDFEKSYQTIDKEVSHYYTLISSLVGKRNLSLEKNNFYLISDEPKNMLSREYSLWDSVNKNEIIKVINPEESDKIADLIEEKNAKTFTF